MLYECPCLRFLLKPFVSQDKAITTNGFIWLSLTVQRTPFLQSIERNTWRSFIFPMRDSWWWKPIWKMHSPQKVVAAVSEQVTAMWMWGLHLTPFLHSPLSLWGSDRGTYFFLCLGINHWTSQCWLSLESCSFGKQWRFRNPLILYYVPENGLWQRTIIAHMPDLGFMNAPCLPLITQALQIPTVGLKSD